MNCCALSVSRDDQRSIDRWVQRYRSGGAGATARRLVQQILRRPVVGASLLDIGGGIGAIQHLLPQGGADRAINVEASAASAMAARAEATHRHLGGRITVHAGDFCQLARTLPSADIVTLDRVVCCYHDMPRLLSHAVVKAQRVFGIVYPHNTPLVRIWVAGHNLLNRMRGRQALMHLHDPREIDLLIQSAGFRLDDAAQDWYWRSAVYRR